MEILQNAIDSEGDVIKVFVYGKYIVIIDNGIGITDDYIVEYFERIGSSSKAEDKTKIGKHGIGFLQFIKYGRVAVRTLDTLMWIDVKEYGRSYKLHKMRQHYQGTMVVLKFYDKYELDSWDTNRLLQNLKQTILKISQDIYFNGEKHEVKVKTVGGIKNPKFEAFWEDSKNSKLYSQGLLVDDRFGAYDDVSFNCLEKMPMDISRTGLVDSDEKRELYKFIQDVEEHLIVRKKVFSKETGLKVAKRYMNGKVSIEAIKDKEIIKSARGSGSYSVSGLLLYDMIYFGKSSDRLVDKAIQRGLLVIDVEFRRFLERYVSRAPGYEKLKMSLQNHLPAELMDDDKDKVLKKEELKKKFKSAVTKIFHYGCILLNEEVFEGISLREITIGQSKNKKAWTDASKYIVLNVNIFTKRVNGKVRVFEQIMSDVYETLIHEYAHDEDSFETDLHGPEYDSRYRKLVEKTVLKFGMWMGKNRYNKVKNLADADGFLD
jgi:hypothetical protein